MKIIIRKEWCEYSKKWQYSAHRRDLFGVCGVIIAGSIADSEEQCIAQAKSSLNHNTTHKTIDIK